MAVDTTAEISCDQSDLVLDASPGDPGVCGGTPGAGACYEDIAKVVGPMALLVDQPHGVVLVVQHGDHVRGALLGKCRPSGSTQVMLENVLQLLARESDGQAEHWHGVGVVGDERRQSGPVDC